MSGAGGLGESQESTLAAVLGRVASGLFVVTARSVEGLETGLLASWVQQASFEPPMLTVAINRKRYLHRWLESSPVLGISVIGEGQKELLKHFGAGFEESELAFEGLDIVRGATGVPLLQHSLGSLEGVVDGSLSTGDHVIYSVRITSAQVGTLSGGAPWVHIRKNGLKY